ncbi:hypothetical protein AADS62_004764, partial [Escherichia coli]
ELAQDVPAPSNAALPTATRITSEAPHNFIKRRSSKCIPYDAPTHARVDAPFETGGDIGAEAVKKLSFSFDERLEMAGILVCGIDRKLWRVVYRQNHLIFSRMAMVGLLLASARQGLDLSALTRKNRARSSNRCSVGKMGSKSAAPSHNRRRCGAESGKPGRSAGLIL